MAMTTTKQEAEKLPEDVELLLPWHAAGTLSRRDAARVEQALANDHELAARYELVREELGEAIRLNESLGAPSARAMEQLFAEIDAEPARAPRASVGISGWFTNFVAGLSPRTLAYGATAAALAIVLQAGILAGVVVREQTSGPQLASYRQSEPAGAGAYVQVRFKPQATAAEITAFLSENNAVLVDGPRDIGFFRVRVSGRAMTPSELSAAVRRMAGHRVVDSAAPSPQ
jgi:hypothetical protein